MAEATMDTMSSAARAELEAAAREFDFARMKQIGGVHFAMVVGSLTMWGAAMTWSDASGSALAAFAAIGAALVAGHVIPSTIHEWGHFIGARLSGAASPVVENPNGHFVLFDFKMKENDVRQFSWMSWGGILAPWIPVLVAWMFVPLAVTSGALLFSTLFFKAVATAAFEVPIAQAAEAHGDPGRALTESVTTGGLPRSRKVGQIAGVVCFLLVSLIY